MEKAGDVVSHHAASTRVVSKRLRDDSIDEDKQDVANHEQTLGESHPTRTIAPGVTKGNVGLFSGSRCRDKSSIFSPSYQRPSVPTGSSVVLPIKRSQSTEEVDGDGCPPVPPAKRRKSGGSDNHALNTFSFVVQDVLPDTTTASASKPATSPADGLPSSSKSPVPMQTQASRESIASPKPPAKRKIIILKRRKVLPSHAPVSSTSTRPVATDGPISPTNHSLKDFGISTTASEKSKTNSLTVSKVTTVMPDKPNSVPMVTSTCSRPVRVQSDSSTTLSDIQAPDCSREQPCEGKDTKTDTLCDAAKRTDETDSLPSVKRRKAAESVAQESEQDQGIPRRPSLAEVRAEM